MRWEAATEIAQTEGGLKGIEQRIGQVTAEIATLEGELSIRREELRSWQAVLDRRLARHQG